MGKSYFTFCYNGSTYSHESGVRTNGEKHPDGDAFEPHKYALVVQTTHPKSTFSLFSEQKLTEKLFGKVLYGWFDSPHLVISSVPAMVREVAATKPNDRMFIKTKVGRLFDIPIRKLERMCISPLKFGVQCEGCVRHDTHRTERCYLNLVTQYAAKHLRLPPLHFLSTQSAPIDAYVGRPQHLHTYILHALGNGCRMPADFEYLSPRSAREDLDLIAYGGVPFLRYYGACELDTTLIDERRARASARSRRSAETRKLQARCRKECAFAPCDKFSRRSSRSWVRECDGPYSKDYVYHVYEQWVKSLAQKRSREDIAFIAFNAGEITRVLGYELTLKGMDKNLEHVEFVGRYNHCSRTFRFRDAVEILNTAWNRGDRDYARPQISSAPEMPDEDLWAYAQARQFIHAPGYAARFGWVDPYIRYVCWKGPNRGFTIHSHCGWDRNPDSLTSMLELFGLRHTLEPTIRKVLPEEECQESSPDTQP